MNRSEFLGNPKITTNANAKDLKPSAILSLKSVAHEPFMNGLTAQFCDSGSAVFNKGTVIASYDFGDTLVVERSHRKQGIAQELVYQWRRRYPAPAKASTRTKASQAIQEKVWDRFQKEGFFENMTIRENLEKLDPNMFNEDEFVHGTTLLAYESIKDIGIVPMCGAFIREMYGLNENEVEDDLIFKTGVFFSNPNGGYGLWGAANAMRAAVSRQMGVSWHAVTLDDVQAHGAFLVIQPNPESTYQYSEEGLSTSLLGFSSLHEPPMGAEPEDYYSFETQSVCRLIQGDELCALMKTIRRQGDDGTFLFKERCERQSPG